MNGSHAETSAINGDVTDMAVDHVTEKTELDDANKRDADGEKATLGDESAAEKAALNAEQVGASYLVMS